MSTPAKAVPVKAVPEGYHTVTPYLVVQGAGKLIDFMKAPFDAQEMFRMPMPDGSIGHAELRIGNSMIMLGEASSQWKAMPATATLPGGRRRRLRPRGGRRRDADFGADEPVLRRPQGRRQGHVRKLLVDRHPYRGRL